jgi:murein DD-endopeptidase MepM/ murein hydrolase activator NlpD
LDLDGDGDSRTGWDVFYLHLSDSSIVPTGTIVKTGDPIGVPSCEGGKATGTHVHIARKYNGEWMPAGDGLLAFNLEGWVAADGQEPYQGILFRYGKQILASTGSGHESQIQASIP